MNDQTELLAANKPMILGAALVLGVVIIAILFWASSSEEEIPQQLPEIVQPEVAVPPKVVGAPETPEVPIKSPLEAQVVERSFAEQALIEDGVALEPLPPLDDSDTEVHSALEDLSADTRILQWLVPEEVVRKFVRAVENVRQGKLVHKYRPLNGPRQPFYADKMGQQYRMSFKAYHRYDAYAEFLAELDMPALVKFYRRYYPLLQQAYGELGVGSSSFHSTLLAAIDNLMEAPVVEGELLLKRPSVMYKYTDPALENLPDTHKLMLRMGPENTRSVQRSLGRLRQALAE